VAAGFQRGRKNGYRAGRKDGYKVGEKDGYEAGYDDGLLDGSYGGGGGGGGGACNPNYSGCLKANASDYDCVGGSGDGPYYTGTVEVIGYDEYDLDRDGDGIGCD
jgi:hypothetical protein